MFIELPIIMDGETPKLMTFNTNNIIGFRAMLKGDSQDKFDKHKSIILLSQTALVCSIDYRTLAKKIGEINV